MNVYSTARIRYLHASKNGRLPVVGNIYFNSKETSEAAWAEFHMLSLLEGDFLVELVDASGTVQDKMYLDDNAVEEIIGLPVIDILNPIFEVCDERKSTVEQ